MPVHRVLFSLFAQLAIAPCSAQVVSFGVHLNPTLCTSIPDAPNPFGPEIRLLPAQLGYKYGAQTTITSDRASLEASFSLVEKTLRLRQTDFSPADFRDRPISFSANGISVEASFLARYAVVEHTGRSEYSIQLLAGAGREFHNMELTDERSRSDTVRGGTYTAVSRYIPPVGAADVWTNVIAGAQIRTVLRNIGLVEYGFAFHYPLQSIGPYRMETTVSESQRIVARYSGEFYPRLAYLDFRLCYYVYSFRHGEGRVRYRE